MYDNVSTCTFPILDQATKMLVNDSDAETTSFQSRHITEISFDDDLPDLDPFDKCEVLPEEDELLAPNPGTFERDGYPHPQPPADFIKRMEKESERPGCVRQAPTVTAAITALQDMTIYLRGKSRGKSHGYKEPKLCPFVRAWMEGIRTIPVYKLLLTYFPKLG